jgi:prefoldin subunit 5
MAQVYAEAELLRARVAKLESREASKAASAEAVEAVEALQSKLDETLVELGVQTDLAEKRKETLNTQANETQERIASETAK